MALTKVELAPLLEMIMPNQNSTYAIALLMQLTRVLLYTVAGAVSVLCALVSLALACDTIIRRRTQRGVQVKEEKEEEKSDSCGGRSGIYAGRVWHVRLKPTVHRFSYPVFYCLIDLDEVETAMPW